MRQPWIKVSEAAFDMLLMIPKESAGNVINAAAKFFKYGIIADDLSDTEKIIYDRLQADISDSQEKYNATCARNTRNAKNAGRKSTGNPLDFQNKSSGAEKKRREEKRKEIEEIRKEVEGSAEGDKPPRATRFTPPSLTEVEQYCKERGNKVDAQRFIDFYTAKGWKIGKQSMKDWKATVRIWERNDNSAKTGRTDTTEKDYYKGWEGYI